MASFLDARTQQGTWRLRIDDLDGPRAAPGASDTIIQTLESFGFEWDGPIVYQSACASAYARAFEQIESQGLIFGCHCSRREIADSMSLTGGREAPVYPGTCRSGLPPGTAPRAWRLKVQTEVIEFIDRRLGRVQRNLAREVGDFILKRADGLWAYQLAVVVDDAAMEVTDVVRGADLLESTARQIYLYACLKWTPPRYLHVPVVTNVKGQKLSKQTGAPALDRAEALGALHQAGLHLGLDIPRVSRIPDFWRSALISWQQHLLSEALSNVSPMP